MKRIIATVALLVSVAFIAKADERPIEVNSMPKAAVEFINSHFAQVPVLLATVDRELMDTDYEVRLEDGTSIDFDGKGRWVEVSNKRVGVPASVIPKSVATFLANEEKKRLLKSGKDNAVAFSLKRHRVYFKDGDLF